MVEKGYVHNDFNDPTYIPFLEPTEGKYATLEQKVIKKNGNNSTNTSVSYILSTNVIYILGL